MYLKDEWFINNEQLKYDEDYEELPYIYCNSVEKNIMKLYSLGKDNINQAKKIIESCEFTIELMLNEFGAIDEAIIESYRILILAYKLFRIDEEDSDLAAHVLQIRVFEIIEGNTRYEEFSKMFYLLDDLLPDFDSVFYKGDFASYSQMLYEYKILVKCRRYIINYNYEAAYKNYIELMKNLTKKNIYDYEKNSFEQRKHINWTKKHFTNLLKVAKMIGKLGDVEKQVDIIFDNIYCLFNEADKKEFKLLIECERCFENYNDKIIDIISNLVDIFEAKYRKEGENGRDYTLYMDFLVQASSKLSCEEKYWKIILNKMIEISINELKHGSRSGIKNYTEDLRIAIFRMLPFEDFNEKNNTEVLGLRKDMEIQRDIGKSFFVAPLIKWGLIENSGNKETADIMKDLSSLYNKVFELENYVKVKKYDNEKIAYYTTLQTLGYLLMDENVGGIEKCRLSVMNVGYMNDPNEGKVINEVFEKNIANKTKEFYEFINVNDKRLPKRTDKNLIFLKSFSDKVDRLTMWSEYGDKGNGVCIVLNGKTFQNANDRINLLKGFGMDISVNDYDDYDLYKVIYWSKNDNAFWANGLESDKLNKKMNDILVLMEEIFNKISVAFFTNIDKSMILMFIKTLFSKLKYLIKFEEYKDENETRLVFQRKTVNSFKDIEEIPGEVALKNKIYIHYPVQTMISEIILGPKNIESDEYIPFLIKRTCEINESSGYSTDICKSAIDYR